MRTLLFALVLLLSSMPLAQAVGARMPDDGFTVAQKSEAKYFTVHLAPGVDQLALAQLLAVGAEQKLLAGRLDVSAGLADSMDAFFLWACSILDMQLYSYHGSVKVVQDDAALSEVYRHLHGAARAGLRAFYVYDNNTLYVAATDFTREVVGHEIAHAIISNFFVVQPPEKVQEVLAGYIEYQLRKKTAH